MKPNTLYTLPIGNTARIKHLHMQDTMRRRLLDMGLTKNTRATCLYESPAGDPRAYLIRGTVIALRTEDAKKIEIQ